MNREPVDVAGLLRLLSAGDSAAAERLFPLLYQQLRELAERQMARERHDHTLQATALVHEAYLKLVHNSTTLPNFSDETHFMAIAAVVMRRILVDHAVAKKSLKRGGDLAKVQLDDLADQIQENGLDIQFLDDALQQLAKLDPLQAQIVELRYFGGLTVAQCSQVLDISQRSVQYEWAHARAWLKSQLQRD